MQRFISYLKNVRAELTHVVWPSRKQAIEHVILIILISAFAAAFIAAIDVSLEHAVTYIINNH
jgi:preprotein translocase SecE subunit